MKFDGNTTGVLSTFSIPDVIWKQLTLGVFVVPWARLLEWCVSQNMRNALEHLNWIIDLLNLLCNLEVVHIGGFCCPMGEVVEVVCVAYHEEGV